MSPSPSRGARAGERIGVFGGSFDPPHFGHLALAEWARLELALDRVVFVPAGVPPHKRVAARSTVAHRVAMTRLAVRDNPSFAVETLEAKRRGPSYTVDTVRALAARWPGARTACMAASSTWMSRHRAAPCSRNASAAWTRWRISENAIRSDARC